MGNGTQKDANDKLIGGTFTFDPTSYGIVAEGYVAANNGDGTYTVMVPPDVAQVTIGGVTTKYKDLQTAFYDATTNDAETVTLEMLENVTVANWTAMKAPDGLTHVQSLTIKGNSKTITGITEPLFSRSWQGDLLEIDDLTIANAKIIDYNSVGDTDYGTGAFIGYAGATTAVTLKNCHVSGGTISGGYWCGGLVGYCSQVNPLTFDGCSVENATISNAMGSTGGLIGHATGDQTTGIIVKGDTVVSGNTITGKDISKTGVVLGTVGAGTNQIDNLTVFGNSVGSDLEKRIFGRIGSTGGIIRIAAGSFSDIVIQETLDKVATFEISGGTYNVNPPAAFIASRCEVVDNGNNTWTVQIKPMAQVISEDGTATNKCATLQAAFNAVKEGETIEVLADNSETITVTNTCAFAFNSNGYDLSNGSVTPAAGYAFERSGNICHYGIPVAQVTVGQTASYYLTLSNALNAAKTAGSVCELLKDVDLTGVEWTPVADFFGSLDGNGHKITGLSNVMFASIGSTAEDDTEPSVYNLTIEGANVNLTKTQNDDAYGILAKAPGTDVLFSNVWIVASSLTVNDERVGAFAGGGYAEYVDCVVSNCTISGTEQVGGLVGYVPLAKIERCAVVGSTTVTATGTRAGGLVGKFKADAEEGGAPWIMSGNTVSCTVSTPGLAGGLAGQMMGYGSDSRYEIKNNSINVTFAGSPSSTSPVAPLRADSEQAFNANISRNITGNWWENTTLAARSYTYPASLTGAGDQTIYCGVAGIVGGKNYKTLAAALADVKDGDTIEIYADNAEAVTVPDGVTTFTFKSNGFDLSKGSISMPGGCKFVRDGNVCTYQPRVYGVAVTQADGTVRGTYETVSEAVTAAQEGDTVSILQDWTEDLAVPAGKTITFNGGAYKLTGEITVGDGGSLAIVGGTFTAIPLAYLPKDKAVRTNDDGTYTVVAATVAPVQETIPVPESVKDESGTSFEDMPAEKQAQAAAAVETLSSNLVESVASPVVTQTDTGVGDVAKANKSTMIEILQAEATEQGLTEEAKSQIADNIEAFVEDPESNTNSSNCVTIEVAKFDATVTSVSETAMTGTATKVVFDVTPVIKTTVTNTVGGVSETVTVSAVIPNATVKAMAEKGSPITFNLPISDPNATMATVRHVSSDPATYPDETFNCSVWQNPATGERFITVVVSHFSQFEVTTSGAVLVDSDETIGIIRLDRMTAGETAFGVPFTKSGVATETAATLGELVVTGAKATGSLKDSAKSWTAGSDDTSAYATVAATDAPATGDTVWYARGADSSIPLALAGYVVTNGLKTTAAASSSERPGLTLFTNPNREAVADVFAKLSGTLADGDQIVVAGGGTRYLRRDGAWREVKVGTVQKSTATVTVRAATTDAAADALPLPAGGSFWYVSRGGTPTVNW